jgi:hypothetical protein
MISYIIKLFYLFRRPLIVRYMRVHSDKVEYQPSNSSYGYALANKYGVFVSKHNNVIEDYFKVSSVTMESPNLWLIEYYPLKSYNPHIKGGIY